MILQTLFRRCSQAAATVVAVACTSASPPFAHLAAVTPALANTFHLGREHGALVIKVTQGSPASERGLVPGDVVTRFAGQEVRSASQLWRAIRESAPGRSARLTVWGRGGEKTVEVTPVEAPKGPDYSSSGRTTPM
jgi:S1-C subfamily serine protease